MAARQTNSASFPCVCDGHPDLIFHIAEPDDEEELTAFIMMEFFHRFPLKDIDGFDVEKEVRPWIGEYIKSMCSKNYSIILRDTANDNRIAAAAVNDYVPKDRPEDHIDILSFSDPLERPGWQIICDLLCELHKGVDLPTGEPTVSIDLMTVGDGYVNRGLAVYCAILTIQLAKSRGVKAITLESVNEYMSRVSVKAGFSMLKEIDYNQYEISLPEATKQLHKKAGLYIYKM